MTNNQIKSKTINIWIFSTIFIVIFIFSQVKTISYTKYMKIENSTLKTLKLNNVIQDVAISRKLEIKISGVNGWQRVGGSKLELNANEKEPEDSFLKGDSILKKNNCDTFIIVRNNHRFTWILP